MDAMKKLFKGPGNIFKKIVQFIIRMIRFIPTVLGQICTWLVIIILAIIGIYILVDMFAKGIAKILGIDTAGMTNTSDYAVLSQITANGYDELLPADTLQEFYAYEYAVLMDLARNIEEAGTYMPKETDEASYDPILLNKEEWAKLCADTFVLRGEQQYTKSIQTSHAKKKSAYKTGSELAKQGKSETEVKAAIKAEIDNDTNLSENQIDAYADKLAKQAMAENGKDKPSNEQSKNELIYKAVSSNLTEETSLVPYLIVERPVKIYSYQFIDTSLNVAGGENTKDYTTILRTGKGGGFKGDSTYKYIRDNIEPLTANATLNANNIALYKKGAPGSSKKLDLDAKYSEGIFYGEKNNATVTYQIPLKVLADRFMPKAVLLSSWYMLKQNEVTAQGEDNTATKILNEIKDIYNKACLGEEDISTSNWILVKDVVTSGENTGASNDMTKLFTRAGFSSMTATDKYAFKQNSNHENVSTDVIYEKYNTKFDSRILTNGTPAQSEEINPEEDLNPEEQEPTPVQSSLLAEHVQTFGGTLRDDIIDDIELVLTHHNEVDYGFMNEVQYEKFKQDLNKILESSVTLQDVATNSSALKEYVIYKTNEKGEYIIDCTKFNNGTSAEHHHEKQSGTSHKDKYGHEIDSNECIQYIKGESEHKDPYAPNAATECFVPYMKFMFGRVNTGERKLDNGATKKVSVKSTAIIIFDGETEYLYRVDEKEIEDIAGLTNKGSFMEFDRYDAQMTNFGDWDESNSAEDAEERTYFIITDAFEAWPIKIDDIDLKLNSHGYYSGRYRNEYGEWEHFKDTDGTFVRNQIKKYISEEISKIDVSEIVNNNINIYSGGLAVIKDDKDANNEFLAEALIPPQNAAPKATSSAKLPYYTTYGESDIVTGMYINMKEHTADEMDEILKEVNKIVKNKLESIFESYCRMHSIAWTIVDENGVEVSTKTVSSFAYGNPEIEKEDKVIVSASEADKVVVYPVEMRVTTIKQDVKQRQMTMYLPYKATTWANTIEMGNEFQINGKFDPTCSSENGGYFQLVPRAVVGQGLKDIQISIEKNWRTAFYAPYFTTVRESDVLAMIAEWEKAGTNGQFAAYTYIRDLYSLIQKAKTVNDANGNPYVNKDSYTYMYVPDEILYFDESITDKAYWLERMLATSGADSIKYEENLTMRNKRNVKTWQIVDYEQYDECIIKDDQGNQTSNANVYALWPLGGYLGRSLYAFEANSNAVGNKKVLSWGAYVGPGVHSGVDLYGRGNALRIYTNAYTDGEPKITAEYNNGNVILKDGKNSITINGKNSSGSLGEEDEGVSTEGAHNEGDISGNRNVGAYMSTTVPINIDGTTVNFGGSSSAVYGYELYRLTKKYKNGEKAEKALKEALEEEMNNTPIVAIAPGIVKSVKGGARPGFMVTVEHATGVESNYLHMKRWPEVQAGEYIGAGTIIGYEGTTGNSGGNHLHHEIETGHYGGIKVYPIAQLYPFFTPFYYEEKAAEVEYDISNDYLSIDRTIFPYGQIVSGIDTGLTFNRAGQTVTLKQVEQNNGEIVIKNYVPTKPLTTVAELHTDTVDENAKLLEKIAKDGTIDGEVTYNGDDVIALPQYFDKEFMDLVASNGGHILISEE